MQIRLNHDEYFNYGERYFVEFSYESKEQQDKMFKLFEEVLIPHYGASSSRAEEGKEYIMPYLADELGNMTAEKTGKIGGCSIPDDLLPGFIKRFVEKDHAIVKIGDGEIKDTFNEEQFNSLVSKINNHKTK